MRVTEEDRSVPSAFRSGAIICIESWPKTRHLFEPFLLLKMYHLPRQARDEQSLPRQARNERSESTQKMGQMRFYLADAGGQLPDRHSVEKGNVL